MLAERKMRAFHIPAGIRWRVSTDERDRLIERVAGIGAVHDFGDGILEERMLGAPLVEDEALPPRSIILEPIPGA